MLVLRYATKIGSWFSSGNTEVEEESEEFESVEETEEFEDIEDNHLADQMAAIDEIVAWNNKHVYQFDTPYTPQDYDRFYREHNAKVFACGLEGSAFAAFDISEKRLPLSFKESKVELSIEEQHKQDKFDDYTVDGWVGTNLLYPELYIEGFNDGINGHKLSHVILDMGELKSYATGSLRGAKLYELMQRGFDDGLNEIEQPDFEYESHRLAYEKGYKEGLETYFAMCLTIKEKYGE